MALHITNINELNNYNVELIEAKKSYDETIKKLLLSIKQTEDYWQGEEGNSFREQIYNVINKDLTAISNEFEAEIFYIKKLQQVLENAQEQIKNRLNG